MTTINRKAPRARFTAACFGRAYIAGENEGVVSVDGVPTTQPIFLFNQETMALIRSTWSDENGNYRLNHLDPTRKYIVLSLDKTGECPPVCVDNVVPYVP